MSKYNRRLMRNSVQEQIDSVLSHSNETVGGKTSTKEVYEAILDEREYQVSKWGSDKQQSLGGYILMMEKQLADIKDGWNYDLPGRKAPLNTIIQLAAVCVAALESYGLTGNTISTKDISDPQK